MWQMVIILAECIILAAIVCIGIFLAIKFRKQNVVQINIKNDTEHVVSELADYGPVSEMPKVNESPMGFYTGVEDNETIRSGGELIPQNLSDGERELLRMFYND